MMTFWGQSLKPDFRTEISCSPGKSNSLLSSLSSLTYPTYWPSIHTPDVLSALVFPTSFTSPSTWFCADIAEGKSTRKGPTKNTALQNRLMLFIINPQVSTLQNFE